MSNAKTNAEQNKVVELSPNQSDPGLARAEDFAVSQNTETPAVPLHGQHGETPAEYKKLLAEKDQQ